MRFKIRCTSIKEFDHETGSYAKCNREVEVNSSQVGTLVRCPTCGNDLEVIDPGMLPDSMTQNSETASEDLELALESTNVAAEETSAKPDGLPVSSPDDSPDDSLDDLLGQSRAASNRESTAAEPIDLPPQPAGNDDSGVIDLATSLEPLDKPADEYSLSPLTEPAGSVEGSWGSAATDPLSVNPDTGLGELKKESYQQASGSVLQHNAFKTEDACRKCGTLLEEKQPVCPNCKTRRKAAFVDRKDRKPFSRKGPFGFQLWLHGMVRAPANPEAKGKDDVNWFSLVAKIFSVLLMGTGLSLIVFGGISGVFVGIMVGIAGLCFWIGLRYWDQTKENPRAPIPILGKVVWAVMLFIIRRTQFPKYSEDQILSRQGDSDFGDSDLKAVRDLAKLKVVDLDGTSVTDDGLLYLFDLRGIDFVVVTNTAVSYDGVHDLQQTIPKAWIWC